MQKISVIMGIYNCSDTLYDAINSILNQTYPDWELVMCDDGSSDNTYKIAEMFYHQYPDKIKLLRNEHNMGLPATLNNCLKAVTGEFVARMDGDDISLPDRFEKQISFLISNPEIDCVGTGMTRFDDNGDFDNVYPIENPDKFTLKMYPLCYHATLMMKKSCYDAIGGYVSIPRTLRCEDIDMWFRFASKGFKAANINECLYKVREDRNALKRRKFKYAINNVKTNVAGYKLLNYPIRLYPFAFKPIVSHFIPYRLKVMINQRRNNSQ